MFKNLNIQNRLLGAFVIISLVGMLTAALNIYNVVQMDEEIKQISKELEELVDIEEAQVYFLEQELASKDYLLVRDEHFLNKYDEYKSLSETFMRQSLVFASTPSEIASINALDDELNVYNLMHEELVETIGKEDILTTEEMRELIDAVDEEVERVHNQAETIIRQGRSNIHNEIDDIDSLVQLSIYVGIFSLGIFSLLALLASVTTGQVAEPILHLTNAVVAFEGGGYRRAMLDGIMQRGDEIGRLATAFDRMAQSIEEGLAEREEVFNAASRFVPYEYLDFLQKRSITDIKLGDHVSAEMAVMFSDIRSFTTMSEGMSPAENFDFVNTYLSRVSPAINKFDGFIVKFLGDGMMAIFPYGVDNAIQSGIEKLHEVRRFNEDREANGHPPINVGVGLHTGHMMVGMIGEEDRMQGDAFSDNVNLTSRVEGLTKYYGVSLIITQETYLRIRDMSIYNIRSLGKTQVKGREHPLGLYEVFNADPDDLRQAKLDTLDIYNTALEHYIAGRFKEAEAAFRRVLDGNPADMTSSFFLQDIMRLIEEGRPANWDGVIKMTSK